MPQTNNHPTIDPAIEIDAENAVLCWLATVDAAGTPNVTPKEIFALYGGDRLVIADIASSNSVRNIRHRPTVCVSFIDVFRQRGFKIVGTATIIGSGEDDFSIVGAKLLRMAGHAFPIRHVISVQIDTTSRIWAPSYRVYPDQTEAERMQQAYRAYGVYPVKG
jgi:predicted pyridoxine 5'-phosphate oxidase superfamily flavin-nucleotide-binding protein